MTITYINKISPPFLSIGILAKLLWSYERFVLSQKITVLKFNNNKLEVECFVRPCSYIYLYAHTL